MRSWTIRLPHPRPPLSLNDRMHRMQEAKIQKQLRAEAALLARSAKIPLLEKCEVTLVWHVGTRGRRDEDNIFATMKPLSDGLTDAGIVVDDDYLHMRKLCRIVYEQGLGSKGQYTELVIQELSD